MTEPRILIDIKELSRRLSMSTGTLYNWVHEERLMPIRIGRNLRFDYDEVLFSFRHKVPLDSDTSERGA
jgi:excisionase family DNA binding protein